MAERARAGFVPLPAGGRISYRRQGEGTGVPLLLLRPLGGSMVLWGAFATELGAQRPIITFDPRGAGRSSPAPPWVTTQDMAADAVAVLDHLGIAAAHVFGLSLGGMVATWLAIDAPERVCRLVLASTVRQGLDVSRRGLRRALSFAPCFLRPTAAEVEVCLTRRLLSPSFRKAHPEQLRRIEALLRAEPASRKSLLWLTAAALRHDARAELSRIRNRTLLLWGDRDALLGATAQAELRAALPAAAAAVVRDCGHDLSLEQPAATAAYIGAFLEREG